MSESFDPYKKWLGISPKDQPPHHYRLLGLEVFESDPDVITTAADSRMALVKNFQTGAYSAASQRLLNEIAAARITLLNSEKKSPYDEALREKLKPAVKQAAPPPARKTPASAGGGGEGNIDLAAIRAVSVTTKDVQAAALVSSIARRGQKPAWKTPVLVGAGVLLLGLVALIAVLASRGDGKAVSEQPDSSSDQPADPPQKTGKTRQPGAKQPKENGSKSPAAKTPEIKTPEIKTPEAKTNENPPEPLPKEKPKVPAELNPNRTLANLLDPPNGDAPAKEVVPARGPLVEPKPAEPAAAKKPAVPDDAALQQAKKRVWDVYGKEVSAAKTAKEKLAIVDKMLKQGDEEKNDPAVRYALFATARDVAAEAESTEQAFAAVDAIEGGFDVDGTAMKGDLLDAMLKAVKVGPAAAVSARLVADAALDLGDAAVAADDFETAARFLRIATSAARKAADKLLQRDITARETELKRQKARYAAVKEAIGKLAETPADAGANLSVGHWYCFVKGNWEKGLPLLAKGSDADLAKLAAQDLAAPADPKYQRSLGDQWARIAAKEPTLGRLHPYLRAAFWYQQALPKLTGLDKSEVTKQFDAVTVAAGAQGTKNLGAVQPGNVALASNGTTVAGVKSGAEFLLDGKINNFDMNGGYALGFWPCEWTITFPKMYRLQAIGFLLHDMDKTRFYRYRVQVSADGKKFTDLVDRSEGQWSGWQRLVFPPTAARAVKLIGLHNSAPNNPGFHVVEFEAYCVPPGSGRK